MLTSSRVPPSRATDVNGHPGRAVVALRAAIVGRGSSRAVVALKIVREAENIPATRQSTVSSILLRQQSTTLYSHRWTALATRLRCRILVLAARASCTNGLRCTRQRTCVDSDETAR